MFAALEAG